MTLDANFLRQAADRRGQLHRDHASSRPLSHDYEMVGIAGEWSFAQFSGLMPDLDDKPKGDAGIDFVLPVVLTVDVKTARKANNLLHEVGKPFADIYVLAEYDDGTQTARLVGWTWGNVLRQAPIDEGERFKNGVRNYFVPREKLRPMQELRLYMGKWQKLMSAEVARHDLNEGER